MLVVDKDKICIYDYHEVLMMDCHLFKIQMQGYDLIVRGKDLQMSYYDAKHEHKSSKSYLFCAGQFRCPVIHLFCPIHSIQFFSVDDLSPRGHEHPCPV